jgi:hypothetical protein
MNQKVRCRCLDSSITQALRTQGLRKDSTSVPKGIVCAAAAGRGECDAHTMPSVDALHGENYYLVNGNKSDSYQRMCFLTMQT